MDIKVAVLIDGSFFIRRLLLHYRKFFRSHSLLTAEQTIAIIKKLVSKHLNSPKSNHKNHNYHLYRVYFYDSRPLSIKIHLPVREVGETNRRVIDFAKLPENIYRNELLDLIIKQRKYALRLGQLKHNKQWKLTDTALNQLLKGQITFDKLSNDDFYYDVRQKGVDVKLGMDITTLAMNKLVDKIILIAGDSDFVPAGKLARTSGIDFVLDALHNHIDLKLYEHIDGLVSHDLVAIIQEVLEINPDKTPEWWQEP